MKKIENFTILEEVAETRKAIVYKGRRDEDGLNVILKVLNANSPSPSDIARFKQEYNMIKYLDIEGIVRPVDFIDSPEGYVIIEEDFGGIPLRSIIQSHKLKLASFLDIAAQVAKIIGELHQRHIVHLDLKPATILFNQDSGQAKITDFGISTAVTHENDKLYDPETIRGTLSYVSPEQTGHMNRNVDYRSDMYSLGVTFYELLTGQLPFAAQDPMTMIHFHIARKPEPPKRLDASIPPIVSDIILKLLAKKPEERYQNCYGLAADLIICADCLKKTSRVASFPLAQDDIPFTFSIPQILVGREKEHDILLSTFDKVAGGAAEVMLVSGPPGIGKSALINELHKPIVARGGYFISGKYDRLHKSIPYSAIAQAFSDLVKRILAETDERIDTWKHNLIEAFGPNGKVITDVIFDLKRLIGEPVEVPELGPKESQNRFNLVFQRFVRVFTSAKNPLVLFLDDMQWADSASINLIYELLTGLNSGYFLFIAAYRDTEMDTSHPFLKMIDRYNNVSPPPHQIHLSPLELDDIGKLFAYVLRCDKSIALPLAGQMLEKAGGNPFFLLELAKNLYESGMLALEPGGGWQYDIVEINRLEVTDNVVELLAEKINTMGLQTQNILMVCAAIGSQFDLTTIAIVAGQSVEETLADLRTAIHEELVQFQKGSYRFTHDRIQEAVYATIPPKNRAHLHYTIGRNMEKKLLRTDMEEHLFYIVDQLNRGSSSITDPEKLEQLIRLNVSAGQRALKSNAYLSAHSYMEAAKTMLPDACWDVDYKITYSIYSILLETEYMMGNYENALRIFDTIITHATTKTDKIKLYERMVLLYTSSGNYKQAIHSAREGLALLGEPLPGKGNRALILKSLAKLRLAFGKKRLEDLLDLPMAKDHEILAWQNLLLRTTTTIYCSDPSLFTVLAIEAVTKIIKHGHHQYSCQSIATIGSILGGGFGLFDHAFRMGQTALKMAEKSTNPFDWLRVKFLFSMMILHTKKHARKCLPYLRDAYRHGLDAGDLQYAGHCINLLCAYRIMIGDNLKDILEEYESYKFFFTSSKDPFIVKEYSSNTQMCLCLMGKTEPVGSLSSETFDENDQLETYIHKDNTLGIFYFSLIRLRIYYLFDNIPVAQDLLPALHALVKQNVSSGSLQIPEYHFYSALTLSAGYDIIDKKKKSDTLKKIKHHLSKMKKWAHHCPENFRHKQLLIEAEIARIKGMDDLVEKLYDKAIQSARNNGYLQNEGIANELAAKYQLFKDNPTRARGYMHNAHRCYFRWGALAKTVALEKTYPELFSQMQQTENKDVSENNFHNATDTKHTGPIVARNLDMATVINATQALSGEMDLKKLLIKTIAISIENAGAQTCYVILIHEDSDRLYIEASAGADREMVLLRSEPVENDSGLPLGVIDFVRTSGEDIVLANASEDSRFKHDDYISKHQPKSLLCAPIRTKGKLSGIIYLENNLTTGVFTDERAELMRIFATQVAISIENSRMLKQCENTAHKAAEMRLANHIQMSLLPDAPQIPDYLFAGHMTPAEDTGGDYYDVIQHDQKTFIVIGDVSGHGIPAGLIVMMVQTIIRTIISRTPDVSPSEILVSTNHVITDTIKRMDANKCMSIAVFALYPDGRMDYAGMHQDILIYRAASNEIEQIETQGIWLGITNDIKPVTSDDILTLNHGDCMLLFTKGITEAKVSVQPNRLFGQEQLVTLFGKLADYSPEEIITGILTFLNEGYTCHEDVTLAVLKRI